MAACSHRMEVMMKKAFVFLLVVQSAFADLPLSLEGIAPDAQQFKFGATLSYYNHSGATCTMTHPPICTPRTTPSSKSQAACTKGATTATCSIAAPALPMA